jgi:5-methylthioadenosine/S-adenosylhomocysteine deaminase
MPVNEPVGAVVYSMDTSNVGSVYVGGRARKQAGQLVGADPARVAEQAITSRVYLASKVAKGLGGERCR